jgi:hypothetical protein
MPFAFLSPDVHQSSRSPDIELRELVDVVTEPATLERSRALRSRRSPTVSVFGPLQDRSAVNMVCRKNDWREDRRKELLKFPAQNERKTG